MAPIPISLEVRFQRVPTRWKLGESQWGWTLIPEVDQDWMGRKLTILDDPWAIRNEFLGLKHTEEAALKFLTKVGVWNAIEDRHATEAKYGNRLLCGYFGHQQFFGAATFVTIEELWARQAMWKEWLSDEKLVRLRAEISPPPPATNSAPFVKTEFAAKASSVNTLRLHIDWRQCRLTKEDGKITESTVPQGIVEPFTFHELLVATAHLDLLTEAKVQFCQCCGNPFTGRERKFCRWYCGHLFSVRKKRQKDKDQKRRIRAKKR